MMDMEQYCPHLLHQKPPDPMPPAGYFWHSECAKGTCKHKHEIQCPPSVVCKRCGILENNDPICPKVTESVVIWCQSVAAGRGQGRAYAPGTSRGAPKRDAVFFATRNIHKFCEVC